MKKAPIIFLWIISSLPFIATAQDTPVDAYQTETEGYFTALTPVHQGVVCSDNYGSTLYWLYEGQKVELYSAPGCGRYFSVSADGRTIAFKHVKNNGMQQNVFLKLPEKFSPAQQQFQMERLPEARLCGQVSFARNGDFAYTVDKQLLVYRNGGSQQAFTLPAYANYTALSPDGQWLAFNNSDDKLFVIHLESGDLQQFTPQRGAYAYPVWSPDSRKVAYLGTNEQLYVWNRHTNTTALIGTGGKPSWFSDSETLVFQQTSTSELQLTGSDLYLAGANGQWRQQLTATPAIYEMNPVVTTGNRLLYHTYNRREIQEIALNTGSAKILNQKLIYTQKQGLDIAFFPTFYENRKAINAITYIEDVPYVHQVFDTPTWHDGYGSCAPSTAIMAIAYYNIVPPWPTEVDNPPQPVHVNDYGSYVADKYHFHEFFYDLYSPSRNAWGGYGFMWNNGSPNTNSRMMHYILQHGLESNHEFYTSFEYTTDEVDLGYPHPVCSWITSAGHLTLAIGYVHNQHTVIFNDPYGDKNTPNYPSYDGEDAYYDWPGYNNGYQNLDPDGTHGTIAWTVRARASEIAYNDTIIDDLQFGHGFYMYNEPPSHMQWFRDRDEGHNGHFWWTKTMAESNDVCWIKWIPTIPETATYKVYAHIPGDYADAQLAKYRISHANGTTNVLVNQNNYNNQWVLLGDYLFNEGENGFVYLGDSTGIGNEYLAFDAIHFTRSEIETGIENFTPQVTDFKVYPNPADDDFSLAFSLPEPTEVRIDLLDIYGRQQHTLHNGLKTRGEQQLHFNLHQLQLAPGMYILRIQTGDMVYSKKLIVE